MGKNICVVGAGSWGRNHVKSLHKLNSLGGVVDTDLNLISSLKESYPYIKVHTNLEDALNQGYDAYTVVTPAETHHAIAKKIILAGKHILIEKPMAMSIKEAEELVDLSNSKNINAMVGHVLLFHPAIKKIKDLIDKGRVGNLQYLYSNRLNLGKVRTEENVFWSLAPHDIAIFQFLTKSYPKSIDAVGSTFLQKGIPDLTLTHIKYENDVRGHIFVSWLHPFKEHRLVVIGSEAMISFEDSKEGKPLKLYSKKFDITSGVPEKIDGPVEFIHYEKKMPLEAELEYFTSHLNNKPKIANIDHGLEVTKIIIEASNQLI